MLFATVVNVVLLLLSNENNALIMKIVLSIIYVTAGWISVYLLFARVVQAKKKATFVTDALNGEFNNRVGVVRKVSMPVTLPNTFKFYEITVTEGDKDHVLYFDDCFDVDDIKEGSTVSFCLSDNYVVGYEMVQYEK